MLNCSLSHDILQPFKALSTALFGKHIKIRLVAALLLACSEMLCELLLLPEPQRPPLEDGSSDVGSAFPCGSTWLELSFDCPP